jgi:hypothetical protein
MGQTRPGCAPEPTVCGEERAVQELGERDVRRVVDRERRRGVHDDHRLARPASTSETIAAESRPRSGSAPSSAGLSARRGTSASSRTATAATEVPSRAASREPSGTLGGVARACAPGRRHARSTGCPTACASRAWRSSSVTSTRCVTRAVARIKRSVVFSVRPARRAAASTLPVAAGHLRIDVEGHEEDSNLHPVIPDQALNLVTRVSVQIAPDRPKRPGARTIRTQRTIWMLPRMLPRRHRGHRPPR